MCWLISDYIIVFQDQPDDVVLPVAAEGALGQSSSSQSHGTNIGNVAEGSIRYDSVDSTVDVEKP